MLAKYCTMEDLQKALDLTNQDFDNNLEFRKLEPSGKNVRFTITVKQSKGKGGRLSVSGLMGYGKPDKHIKAACYHAHGTFFDNLLLKVNQNAVIVSMGKQIYKQSYNDYVTGNWEDSNVGSQMHYIAHSEACDCEK